MTSLLGRMGKWAAMSAFIGLSLAALVDGASAQEVRGIAQDWQLGLQTAATESMRGIRSFHDGLLLPIITVIVLFVLGLLLYVMARFNRRSNPTPSRTTHNTLLEVAWTVVPVLILVVIAVPSFQLLYLQRTIPEADMTVKAIGYQWFWGYEYPDHGDLAFDSLMLGDDELEDGQPRLLAVDNPLVVPAGKTVRVLVTAEDVIHNWAMPAFGIKMDAIPGRVNETWFRVDEPGIYYGQCSELCGKDHAYMPIEVRVLSEEDFAAWLDGPAQEFASAPRTPSVPKADTATDVALNTATAGNR